MGMEEIVIPPELCSAEIPRMLFSFPRTRLHSIQIFLACLFLAQVVSAETIAHWRFDEDGFPAGTSAPPNADCFKDSSGKSNTMRRTDGPNPNEYSADVAPFGKDNQLSLRLPVKGEWRDIFTVPAREINGYDFKEMTLEGAFKCESAGTFGGILTKDGQPNPASPYPPLQIAFAREDADPKNLGEHLIVQWTDGASNERMLRSIGPLAKNRWYAFAVVMTPDTASLFLRSEDEGSYTLQQSVPLVGGAMAQSMGTWVIGRGFWNGKLDNPFCGWIDEIRISDEVLPEDKFLFAQP